jgi:hypothetical protein
MELVEGVQLRLLRPPVEAVSPVRGQAPHEREVRAVLPPASADLVGPARARQSLPQVGQHAVVDVEAVWLRLDGRHLCADLGVSDGG